MALVADERASRWSLPAPGAEQLQPDVDTGVAHIARVYNYWLGGQDNFAADRKAAEVVITSYPADPGAELANYGGVGRRQ
jgi:hypothetical protein